MEALNQQGNRTDLTLSQVATKSDTASKIGKQSGESRDQVFRYIRLTNLIPEILQYVDDERIALTPAVEISYLTSTEQTALLETIESEQCTPSLSQAQRMKKLSSEGVLDIDAIFGILTAEKANQKEQIKFKVDDLRKLFPENYTTGQIEKTIMRLILDWQQKREHSKNDRDTRWIYTDIRLFANMQASGFFDVEENMNTKQEETTQQVGKAVFVIVFITENNRQLNSLKIY